MGWRGLALLLVVAGVGALGTLATGAAMGMHASELAHLAALMVPALVVTLVAIEMARPLLARSSMKRGLVAVAIVGSVVGLANLVVLAREMFVNDHDATTLGVLFLYSTGAGVGAALALARARSRAMARLVETARTLGGRDLDARVGRLDGGPELDTLAQTLDDMATQLQEAMDLGGRVVRDTIKLPRTYASRPSRGSVSSKERRGFMRRDVVTFSAVGAVLLVACASGGGGAPRQTPTVSPMPNVVEVGATEYEFSVPPDVRGGVVTMRFTNTGNLPHEFAFGRIDPGRGPEDVRQVFESGEEPPDWMHDVAGVPALSPGRSVTVTRTLEPATYVFFCFFPSPNGTPHAQLGMYTTFQIAGDTGQAPPRADLAISAGGEGLSLPEITAGEHIVELRNEGPGAHGFLILRPEDPDATFEQVFASVEKWFEGSLAGPAPTTFIGGMQSIPAETSVFETITFEAGTYIVWDDDSDDSVSFTVS